MMMRTTTAFLRQRVPVRSSPFLRRMRTTLSREERRSKRAAEEGAAASPTVASGQTSTMLTWISIGVGTGAISLGTWSLLVDPAEYEIARRAQESSVGSWITEQVAYACSPFTEPSREKLLPDWPPEFLNISPDVPCPHTLVIDLEDTLVHATWDRKYGWRHAKRPGAEAFLREMTKYYEIVIFTSNIAGVADPVLLALDKDGCAMHRLYRDATKFVRGTHCKDISRFNRDPRKIVVLDDNARAVQLQPENAIIIKPFVDAADKADNALEDITPFLAAIVNENVQDVPAALSKFSDHNAATIANEYGKMLEEAKGKTAAARSIGLGGFIRQRKELPAPDHLAATGALTAKDIVGEAPEDSEQPRKGRLWQRYADSIKESEESHKQKMEAWQKVLQKKDQQRKLANQQQG